MKFHKTLAFLDKIKRVLPSTRSEAGLTELLSEGTRTFDYFELKFWFEEIFIWLAKDRATEADPTGSVRFRYFFRALDNNPEWKTTFSHNFQAFLEKSRFLNYYSQTGFATEHGLWTDIFSRLSNRVFPSSGGHDFQSLIKAVFQEDEDVQWILSLPDPVILKLKELLFPAAALALLKDSNSFAERDLQSAVLILSAHIAHHGVSFEIRNRLEKQITVSQSSFLALGAALQQAFYKPTEGLSENAASLLGAQIQTCRADIETVYDHMENTGVSVAVVHKLEILTALLERLEILLDLQRPHTDLEKIQAHRKVLTAAAEAVLRGRSIGGHVKHHFYLLSKKVVERNGRSGEHYIARNKSEMRMMLISAIAGGAIVVGMTIFKTLLIRSGPAPLFLATGLWIIYAVGFLFMQFTGSTLATKIPSFTASHLARILKSVRKIDTEDFAAEVRQIAKSQSIALVGNLIGVIPLALGLALLSKAFFGHIGLMDEHYSLHIIQDINPVFSGALFLGALTGIELWLSSLCGGWFENWIVFKGFPEMITNHPRIKKVFGPEWAKWAADKATQHASGVATNISLGFLFGFVPLLGIILGVNLGGHHVTISTTAATFAFAELGSALPTADWIFTVVGLSLIGLLNFFVSFALAMTVAASAQKMNLRRVWFYLRRHRG